MTPRQKWEQAHCALRDAMYVDLAAPSSDSDTALRDSVNFETKAWVEYMDSIAEANQRLKYWRGFCIVTFLVSLAIMLWGVL